MRSTCIVIKYNVVKFLLKSIVKINRLQGIWPLMDLCKADES